MNDQEIAEHEKRCARGPLESAIMRACVEALRWSKDVVVWRQNTGAARLKGKGGREQTVRFGVKGAADLTGIVTATGRRIEIEVKRPGEKPTPHQVSYGEFIRAHGGIYLLVHSVNEMLALIEQELRPTKGAGQ